MSKYKIFVESGSIYVNDEKALLKQIKRVLKQGLDFQVDLCKKD